MKIKDESTVLFPPKRISNFSTLCMTASPERFDDRSGDFFWVFMMWTDLVRRTTQLNLDYSSAFGEERHARMTKQGG
jgi:hypothetical protein